MNDPTQYTVPLRLEAVPHWMEAPEDSTEAEIAHDIICLAYWHMIDKQAENQALGKAKKLKGWNIKKPLSEQTLDIAEQYSELLSQAQSEIEDMMGKDIYARARAMAEGSDKGFDLAVFLEDAMPSVQTRIALEMKERGLLPYLECSDSTEYLLSKRTPWDGTGKKPGIWYEIDFMIKYLIPTLEANGFPRDLILGIRDNYNKARFATPYLRTILNDVIAKANEAKSQKHENMTDKEIEQYNETLAQSLQLDDTLRKLLETTVVEMSKTAKQGGLGALDFRDKMRKIARNAPKVDKVLGYCYNQQKGGMLMISTDDTKMLNAIKMATDMLVDWHLGTPEDFASILKDTK